MVSLGTIKPCWWGLVYDDWIHTAEEKDPTYEKEGPGDDIKLHLTIYSTDLLFKSNPLKGYDKS